jgi:serine/threonine protein kinase
VAFGGVA